MKKLVYINVLLRDDSRTKRLSDHALEVLKNKYEIKEIDLRYSNLLPLTHDGCKKRFEEGEKDPKIIEYAESIRDCDRILIATPFWDMSFPSILKVFFERVSLFNITFKSLENGDCIGNCNCEKILYLTTRGMDIDDRSILDSGYHYLNAISRLYGIDEVLEVSVKKTDIVGTNFEDEIKGALNKLDKILEDF